MIAKESIENLKAHLDIVDITSQFLELKKSGANFKACCPFHDEKTASLVISPAKQIFHCFGCGIGGDAVKFVMEHEKLTYPETLEKLASMVNFDLQYENSTYTKQDTKVLQSINLYYQKLFASHEASLQYIQKRGVSHAFIEKFEIGYAPKSAQTIDYLKSQHLSLADAKELGLIDSGTHGLYSRFIERITFPIYSLSGKLVGFGGRTITNHNAKYINSPQTKIFNKSKLLYGYNIAKEHIYKKSRIIVTEGYLDVIMLHQAGFDTAVATLGTALTKEHLPLLKRGEPKVILAYDGDKAGKNAAFKASVMLSQSNFQGGVVLFEGGLDPADMVKEGKSDILEQMFAHPQNLVEYALEFIVRQYTLSEPEQKQRALAEANEYLQTLSPLLQEEYSKVLASKLNISQKHVRLKSQSKRPTQVNRVNMDIAELSIIKTVLEHEEYTDFVLDTLSQEMFEYHQKEFAMLLQEHSQQSLRGLLLQDGIKVYTKQELKEQMIFLLIQYYNKKLDTIKNNKEQTLKHASYEIRKIRDIIARLRKKELVQV